MVKGCKMGHTHRGWSDRRTEWATIKQTCTVSVPIDPRIDQHHLAAEKIIHTRICIATKRRRQNRDENDWGQHRRWIRSSCEWSMQRVFLWIGRDGQEDETSCLVGCFTNEHPSSETAKLCFGEVAYGPRFTKQRWPNRIVFQSWELVTSKQ